MAHHHLLLTSQSKTTTNSPTNHRTMGAIDVAVTAVTINNVPITAVKMIDARVAVR